MNNQIAIKLNESIKKAFIAQNLEGFEKAYSLAQATEDLQNLLTPEYMAPILKLQGSKLGFRTDKDTKGGYDPNTVKNCLIEAVLTGVQPVGNHFNIIANNCYITKEGFGYLLKNIEGLSYMITPCVPHMKGESATLDMKIEWNYNGVEGNKTVTFPIKVNSYMGPDAVIGKATRKARAWLHSYITGTEVSEGDVIDTKAEVIQPEIKIEGDIKARTAEQNALDFEKQQQNKK